MKKFVLVFVFISIQQFPIYSEVLLVPQQYPKIQWAIDASSTNDTILVSPGIYYENINFLGKSIVVKANGPADLVVIDGSQPVDPNNSSVVKFVTAEGDVVATLDGFTIIGGTGSYSWLGKVGGGIWIENSQAIIKNCIIQNNYAVKGGGIFCGYDLAHRYLSSSVIMNCIITNNAAPNDWGGGIFVTGGTVQVNYCTVAKNLATEGSNLTLWSANSQISNSIFWAGSVTSTTTTNSINYCDIQGGWPSGIGNIDADPMFCDAESSDYHIASNSPCIGAGQDGSTMGALGSCGLTYSVFNYPLSIGTTWTYNYQYDYSHFSVWAKRRGVHLWSVVDSTVNGTVTEFRVRSINIDTVSNSDNPVAALIIDTTYFYIDRDIEMIVARPPSNLYTIVDIIQGYFSGDQTYQIGGRVYKEGLGLLSLYFIFYSNTYYSELLELIEFNGTPVNVYDDDEFQTEPIGFNLKQNYPNPFNPSTKISWQSPVSSWQTLKIFDVLGREVATLVDEYKSTGSYEVEFNASQLQSGVYFYRLQTGSFVETKKMILLK